MAKDRPEGEIDWFLSYRGKGNPIEPVYKGIGPGKELSDISKIEFPVSALKTPKQDEDQERLVRTIAAINPAYMGIGKIEINEEEHRAWRHSNLINDMMQDFTRATIRKWEEKLKAYLQENLRRIGINFENDVEFLYICQNNIKRVSFQDKPNYHEFYYGGIGKENIYLGSYSDKIEIINEGSRVTITIGTSFENE